MARAVLPNQLWKARLDSPIALAQSVVFGIRNGRCIVEIIAAIVRGDFAGEPFEFRGGFRFRKRVHRLLRWTFHARLRSFFGGGAASSSRRRAAARASSVTAAPDNIRAISSTRSSGESNWSSV